MVRPKMPASAVHERSFRVRLTDDDANLLFALAKKADVPPAVMLRAMIRLQLPAFAAMQQAGNSLLADLK